MNLFDKIMIVRHKFQMNIVHDYTELEYNEFLVTYISDIMHLLHGHTAELSKIEVDEELLQSAWDDAPTNFCNIMTCEYDIWLKKYESELKNIRKR